MFKKLIEGSKIAIAAPAGRIKAEDLEFGLDWIQRNGYISVFSEEIFQQYDFGYAYAGTDQHRADQIQNYINDDSIGAIWFAAGGYGSAKIIDMLDFSTMISTPKWLIGYSDITVFHSHLNRMGIQTIHGVTARQLKVPYKDSTYNSLAKALKGEKLKYEISTTDLNIQGQARGKLVGGNLSILYSLLGSESFIQGNDLILFIEDWKENWYHVDRMLVALKRSGLFDQVKGIVVGSFTQMDEVNENKHFTDSFDPVSNQIVHSIVKNLNIPVAFNFPAGHIGDNRAMVMGAQISLEVTDYMSIIEWVE